MNVHFKINHCVWLMLIFTVKLHAEGIANRGYIRFVHAMHRGDGRLMVKLNDKVLNDGGYQLGDVTGGIRVDAGTHQMQFFGNGLAESRATVKVLPGQTMTVIAFAEWQDPANGHSGEWKIRALRLKQQAPAHERTATFISVSQQAELQVEMKELSGQWKSYGVKRLEVNRAPISYPRGYVPLRMGERELPPISVASQSNYVVLLYDDPAGHVNAICFKDRQFFMME